MSRTTRGGLLLVLCLIVVAGLVLTGCGKKEAALQQPDLEFTSYVRGSTVDFNDATFNTMSDQGGEAGFKYGIMKAIYPTLWGSNKDTVAQALFPAPYWRGDGVHTYYSYLTSADQTTVDGTIFATKLSAAEQGVVLSSVDAFFGLYDDEIAAAKALEQNTAYYILLGVDSTGGLANAWKADATAWMTALNSYASVHYSGKTYAQLTYVERATVNAIVFANGAGAINPEYAFWRAMVKTSFRNGNASATYPDVAEARATALYGKSYAALNPCSERPAVDAAVWAALTAGQQANVTQRINGLFTLSTEQVNGVTPDNQNIYFYTLASLSDNLTASDNATQAALNWEAAVSPTVPGTSENTSFYAELKYGQPQWKGMLAYQYFSTDNYDALSTASKAVVDQADLGTDWLSIAQRSPAMPLTSNILYQTLYASVSPTAAAGWKTDVGAGGDYDVGTGINRELALYKWMAYESFRNGTAVTFYPTQLADNVPAGKTYAALTSCERLPVDAAVWADLGMGEQGYVTTAVSSMWGKVQAEMTDAEAMDQTTLAMTLRSGTGTETSVSNFKADVESGVLLRQAFYRWLAKESVEEMASAAPLIQQSVGEFYIRFTNPNKYDISIDELTLYFKTPAGTSNDLVDAARQVLEGIWIPAKVGDTDGQVDLKVIAPTKTYDVITWLVMAGKDQTTAQKLAAQVWSNIQDGTITWTVQADVQVSHEDEILTPETYILTL